MERNVGHDVAHGAEIGPNELYCAYRRLAPQDLRANEGNLDAAQKLPDRKRWAGDALRGPQTRRLPYRWQICAFFLSQQQIVIVLTKN